MTIALVLVGCAVAAYFLYKSYKKSDGDIFSGVGGYNEPNPYEQEK